MNQQWPHNDETPHGAWQFDAHLIPSSLAKPLRIWLEVGDRYLLNPNAIGRDNMHDWVLVKNGWPKFWQKRATIINLFFRATPPMRSAA